MSTTKDITMKQFNGIDYDTLYPKNTSQQVLLNNGALADSLGLTNSDPTVNDALGAISDGTYETLPVGTVIETLRTDLGDNWALTNGEGVSIYDYPEFYELTTSQELTINDYSSIVGEIASVAYYNSSTPKVCFSKHIGDYYILAGREGAFYAWIAYTTNPGSSWTKVSIDSSNAFFPSDIAYGNGYWVICGSASNNSNAHAAGFTVNTQLCVYYATELNGVWTKNTQVNTTYNNNVMYTAAGNSTVTFGNNIFYLSCAGYTSANADVPAGDLLIFTATSPAQTWDKFYRFPSKTGQGALFYKDSNTLLIAISSSGSGSSVSVYILQLNLNTTWPSIDGYGFPNPGSSTSNYTTLATYSNSTYGNALRWCKHFYQINENEYYITNGLINYYIFYFNSSSSSLSVNTTSGYNTVQAGAVDVYNFSTQSCFGGLGRMGYSMDRTSIDTLTLPLSLIGGGSAITAYAVLFFEENGKQYAILINPDYSQGADNNLYKCLLTPQGITPTLSTTGVYTYIKIQ